jgi:ribosomal protein S18 acetylase RimI-like enzyme
LQVWVSPEHRGQGVALDLVDAVFRWAEENGFRMVVATVAKGNARALRFYRKVGFLPANTASLGSAEDPVVLWIGVGGRQALVR